MTDELKTNRDSHELVLDWDDDAVDSWEKELDSTALAEAAPFPANAGDSKKTSRPPAMPSPVARDLPREPERVTLPPLHFAVKPPPAPPLKPPPPMGLPKPPPVGLKPPPRPLLNPMPGSIPGLPPAGFAVRPPEPVPNAEELPSVHPDARKTDAPPAFPQSALSDLPSFARTESGRPRMYRPPSDDERRELEAIGSRTLPPPANGPILNWSDDEDDEEGDNTKIAAIPKELIEAIARADAADRNREAMLAAEFGNAGHKVPKAPEPLSTFASESFETEHESSLSLDTDEAFSLRSSLPAPPMLADDGPQIEIGTSIDDEDDDLSGLDDEDDLGLGDSDIDDEPTGMHSLLPIGSEASQAKAAPPPAPNVAKGSPAPRPAEEPSVLRNLDELAPPSLRPKTPPPAPGGTEAEAPQASPADAATLSTLRKIRAQKRRVDALPLAGSDEAGKRARIELLQSLSARNTGAEAGSLLLQAAEIAEELSDADLSRSLYEGAVTLSPELVAAHQGLGRLALSAGDVAGYAEILERRAAQSTAPRERARAFAALARVRWLMQRDFPGALRAATEAERLDNDDVSHAHLLARVEAAANPGAGDATLIRLAEATTDDDMACLWWTSAGRVRERRGEIVQALACYRQAASRKPSSFEAQVAVARASIARGDREQAVLGLSTLANHIPAGALQDALIRRANVLGAANAFAGDSSGQRAFSSSDPVSIRTAAELALRHAEPSTAEAATEHWAETAVGTERALSNLVLAETRASAGSTASCEEALNQALASDPTFALIPVVRELLARKHGGSLESSQPQADDPLATAALLSRDPAQLSREIDALLRARGEQLSPECTEVLLLDATVEAADIERARATLRADSERGATEERVNSLLTLGDYERRHGSPEQVLETLTSATDLDPRNVLASRAVLRANPSNDLKARVLRREAESSSGPRAAFLLLRAARALTEAPSERLELMANAYEVAPAYAPAMWALHQEARKQGSIERLSDLHAREAGRAKDPHEAVAHLVRAALVRAGDDADAAAAQLTRALDLMPSDPVLRELVIRLGDAVPATLRAEAIQSSAERAPNALKRPATLAAAAAFEDASQPARALALYEAVLADHPGDPIAEMGAERVAKAAGQLTRIEEQKRKALSDAADPRSQQRALEALLEIGAPGDRAEQLNFARTLLGIVPDHPMALRILERRAMETNDLDELAGIEERLAVSSKGPKDRLSRVRLLSLLALRGAEKPQPETLDDLVLSTGRQASRGLWLGRQLMGAGAQRGDAFAMRQAAELTAASTTDQAELSTLVVQGVLPMLRTLGSDAAERLLAIRDQVPTHPTLLENLAEAQASLGNLAEAADLFQESARLSHTPRRIARLHYRAGVLLQEGIQAPERAREAFQRAAEADISYKDVQSRLEQLLSGHNDLAGLVALAEARLHAATVPAVRVELSRKLAQLYEKQDDLAKASQVLRGALELSPEDLPALSQYEGVLDGLQNQRERAEVLVRMARLSRDPDELCDVFFKLGDIYDSHVPDPRRAEAAYRRVIKLAPKHQRALERLSSLLRRTGQTELATESLERLMQVAERPSQRREVAFELSRLKEDAGDFRSAEEVLERLRKTAPTEPGVLRALADFYRRRQAQSALAMHLNRAANDLRLSIQGQPENSDSWTTLVEVLEDKGRKDAAAAAASAAVALGLSDPQLTRQVNAEGATTGLGAAAFSELLDDLVFPDILPASIRVLFRHGAEAMNRTSPLDLKAMAAEKLERKHPLRAIASELAKLSGLGDAEIFVTAQLPYAFVPVSEAPFQILVGRTILGSLSTAEQRYLVARACKIARSQMSVTCRVRPEDMNNLLAGLIGAQVPDYRVPGIEAATLDEMARRVGKHLGKRAREDMLPHAVEFAGQTEVDLSRAYSLASAAANRAALIATGSMPAALNALMKLSGFIHGERPVVAALGELDEAKDLVAFSISEAHFEARQRAGAERR